MQFIDLQAQYMNLKADIDASIKSVLDHGQYIMGKEVAELEKQLSEFVGIKHAITCANGTDALQMLYMAYGIGIGDAVFCPDVTFIATIEPACMLGAAPVFCDVDQETYNICPQSLERQIKAVMAEGKFTPKAVVSVDILGNPADYANLESVCKEYGLLLIEDAAQSMGSFYKHRACGSFGDSAITSFFPAKPLGCYGDGGAIFTNDDSIADICKSLRVHGKGKKGKYHNERIGLNSRLDTLQAAILLPKLKALKENEITTRQQIAKRYNDCFKDNFAIQKIEEGCQSIYAQYVLLAKNERERDSIVSGLMSKGIPTMVYYPLPLHMLEVFNDAKHYGESFANSIDYCQRTFSLPMHPYLSEDNQSKIIDAVLEFC